MTEQASHIIEVDFGAARAEAAPSFDYAAFRAEFVRRKRMTVYERVKEDAAKAKAARVVERDARGVPIWAVYQRALGITQTLHIWQAERYLDPDAARAGERKFRYSAGLMEKVREYEVEPLALEGIEAEARVWCKTGGRTWLWPEEHRAIQLEKRYLRESTDPDKSHKFGRWSQSVERRKEGPVALKPMYGWIAEQMDATPRQIEILLGRASAVYELRANMGIDTPPAVRIASPRIAALDTGRREVLGEAA